MSIPSLTSLPLGVQGLEELQQRLDEMEETVQNLTTRPVLLLDVCKSVADTTEIDEDALSKAFGKYTLSASVADNIATLQNQGYEVRLTAFKARHALSGTLGLYKKDGSNAAPTSLIIDGIQNMTPEIAAAFETQIRKLMQEWNAHVGRPAKTQR